MKVEHYEIMRSRMTRRGMLKSAASVGAVTALGGLGAGLTGRPAMAQDAALRAEILKIPGVGMGSPTDADWQKVGELCLGPTKETVAEGEFAGRRADLHGAQQPEPAQLPVPRLPEALGGLHRRQDQLDRPRAGRLQRAPAAVDRHRHGRLRHHRDGRAVRGRRARQGARVRDARLGQGPDRHGRLRRLPEGAGRHLGRQDLPDLDRRRLPHLRLPHRLFRRGLADRQSRRADDLAGGQRGHQGPHRQERPADRASSAWLSRSAEGLGRLRLLLPRQPRRGLCQASRTIRPGCSIPTP